jgi:hypothetical protein
MPLAPLSSAPTRLHKQRIFRDAGLLELERHLTDVKNNDCALLTGPGSRATQWTDMWARLTIGRDCIVRATEMRTGAGAT